MPTTDEAVNNFGARSAHKTACNCPAPPRQAQGNREIDGGRARPTPEESPARVGGARPGEAKCERRAARREHIAGARPAEKLTTYLASACNKDEEAEMESWWRGTLALSSATRIQRTQPVLPAWELGRHPIGAALATRGPGTSLRTTCMPMEVTSTSG